LHQKTGLQISREEKKNFAVREGAVEPKLFRWGFNIEQDANGKKNHHKKERSPEALSIKDGVYRRGEAG